MFMTAYFKVSGIYGDEVNRTYEMISNKHLLLENIRGMILDDEMESCQMGDKDCNDALEKIEKDDFTTISFDEQVSTLARAIKGLTIDIESEYMSLAGKNKECGEDMKAKCQGSI